MANVKVSEWLPEEQKWKGKWMYTATKRESDLWSQQCHNWRA